MPARLVQLIQLEAKRLGGPTQLEDKQVGCAGLPASFSLRISAWGRGIWGGGEGVEGWEAGGA